MNFKEVWQELRGILTGKTLDALLPPILFAITNAIFGFVVGAICALSLSLILGLMRLLKKQKWQYALGGFILTSIATALSLLSQNALSYFIPAMITSALLTLAALISNLIKKPLAAWVSHLTRGWPLEWFWRDDILPAYRQVTWAWMVFFFLRLSLQVFLFSGGQIGVLSWTEILLGWPATILVLVASYIFGIWKLRKLGGPGVDEYQKGTKPPWRGQTRGF